jgi:hypothetical protein
MMSVMLENISRTPLVAIATTSAVYRTAQIIASIPNLSYQNKVCCWSTKFEFILAVALSDFSTVYPVSYLSGISRSTFSSIAVSDGSP